MEDDGSSELDEIDALKQVVEVLSRLEPTGRVRVLRYISERYGLDLPARTLANRAATDTDAGAQEAAPHPPALTRPALTDIRTLREQKEPKNAIEMATLVAYYLAEHAPEDERSGTVNSAAITKYFKQANYPLPQQPVMTLVNAKNAGYLDAADRAHYKLNPVGYNLIAHGLPRQAANGTTSTRATRRPTRATKRAPARPAKTIASAPKSASRSSKGTGGKRAPSKRG